MSYMLPDPNKQTSCKECIFAIYSGDTQTNCLHGRIENFKDDVIAAYDDKKEFFVIKRKCNFFRPKSWNNGDADIYKAEKESAISFDLLIDCDDIDDEYKKSIIEGLKTINYPLNRLKITLYHSYLIENYKRSLFAQIYQNFPDITVSMFFDKKQFIYEYIMKADKRFHVLIDRNSISHIKNDIEYINKFINYDLLKSIIFKTQNNLFVMNAAYRAFSSYSENKDYSFIVEKIFNESKDQGLYNEKGI